MGPANSPPWLRRNGRDLMKMLRSHLIGSGRGGLFSLFNLAEAFRPAHIFPIVFVGAKAHNAFPSQR